MADAKPDESGNVTCPKCAHVAPVAGNTQVSSKPKSAGLCRKIWKCPQCAEKICIERDEPEPTYTPTPSKSEEAPPKRPRFGK